MLTGHTSGAAPCVECPFRRTSAPGYLGEASYQPMAFIGPHWMGEAKLPCHMQVDWLALDRQAQIEKSHTCVGYAIMNKNTAKMPRNAADADTVRKTEANHELIFSNLGEFIEHHKEDTGGN